LQRGHTPNEYAYSFNGKRDDEETGTQDYGMRIYNPSLGRFLTVDPITSKFPMLTPFQFASNNPIWMIDLDGLEGMIPEPPMEDDELFRREMEELECEDNLISQSRMEYLIRTGRIRPTGTPLTEEQMLEMGMTTQFSLSGMPKSVFGMNPYLDALGVRVQNWRFAEQVINDMLEVLPNTQVYLRQVQLQFVNAHGQTVYMIADGLAMDAEGNWTLNEIKFSDTEPLNANNVGNRITERQGQGFLNFMNGNREFTFRNRTEYLNEQLPEQYIGQFLQGGSIQISGVNIFTVNGPNAAIRDATQVAPAIPYALPPANGTSIPIGPIMQNGQFNSSN